MFKVLINVLGHLEARSVPLHPEANAICPNIFSPQNRELKQVKVKHGQTFFNVYSHFTPMVEVTPDVLGRTVCFY